MNLARVARLLPGVGARLAAALFAVVIAVLALVYLIVVPSLERRLINTRLDELAAGARFIPDTAPQTGWQVFADDTAERVNARVVVFQVSAPATTLLNFADSGSRPPIDEDAIVNRAALTVHQERGTVDRAGERYAEVAFPLPRGAVVVLYVAPLHETLSTVHLVERRLLIGGLLALVLALAVGYGGAWLFARRIRRLERAAERIAAGRFDEPVIDTGNDELGELATAFDRMRERLSQLDNARREFIANASHELRTPLFALGGSLELLQDEDMDDRTRADFLVTMHEQVQRLTTLAGHLLDLTRLDAGRLRLELASVDLAAVAADVVDEFRAVARATDHPLAAAGEPGVALVITDAGRALQIARIMVENALIHTPPGTPVRVRAERAAEIARLVVEDEGPGLAAEQIGQIFERFYRADGGRASGSGLGLAIARELATVMGGAIEVDSRPGLTRFALVLPVESGAGGPRDEETAESVPARA